MSQESEPYLIIKVSLLGPAAVGKTSLAHRLIYDRFDENLRITLGVDFFRYDIPVLIKGKETFIRLSLWDFGGQDQFKQFFTSYIIGTSGIILVFDISNIQSLMQLEWWWKKLIAFNLQKVPKIVIGAKSDLINPDDKEAKKNELVIKRLLEKYNETDYIKTSSRDNNNVELSFKYLTEKVLEKNLINYDKFLPTKLKLSDF